MINGRDRTIVACARCGQALRAVGLGLSVFAAGLVAPGHIAPVARAEALPAASVGMPDLALRMAPRVRTEVSAALAAMSDADLSLTYVRINATFREFLGHDDLSVARALIDYAVLAEAELRRRNLTLPEGTESAAELHLAFELIL